MKKVHLLIINDAGISGGGTECRIRLILQEFLKNGFFAQVHIAQKASARDVAAFDGVIVHRITGKLFVAARQISEIIKKHSISIVQAHNTLELSPGFFDTTEKGGVPSVWFAHDYWPLCGKRSFIDPYSARSKKICTKMSVTKCIRCSGIRSCIQLAGFRRMLQKAQVGIAACEFISKIYEAHGLLRNKWIVIDPWIDADFFVDEVSRNRLPWIVFTGSLVDYKGAWVLADAFCRVIQEFPDVELKIIGSEQEDNNHYKNNILGILEKGKALSHTEFLGWKNKQQLKEIYKQASVYVCPTVCMESFGLNWAEAMATGCPVVASAVGSIPDFLKGKGVLVEPRNPQELAKGLLQILRDKPYAAELSAGGARFAKETFDPARASASIIQLYDKLLS